MSTILDLLQQNNIHPKKMATTNGGEYQGPCPKCGGKDRFHVWPEEGEGGKWWCRGCDTGGDVIQYLRDFRGLSYQAACLEAGIKPQPMKRSFDWDKPTGGRKWTPREINQPPAVWSEKCSSFLTWSIEQLQKTPSALRYLLESRGLNDDTIKAFNLGFNPSNLSRERSFWGLPDKSKKDGTPQDIWLPRGIVIPYFSAGILQRARIRRIEHNGSNPTSGPPYCIVSGSTSAAMIILEKPSGPGEICAVVESEFDGILLHQEAGDLVTVIALGSASARPDMQAFNILSQAKLILVALDSDEDHDQNTGAIQSKWWLEHFPQARRLPPIEGKDPGESWKNGVELREWISIGINRYYVKNTPEEPVENTTIEFEALNQAAIPVYNQIAEVYQAGCIDWLKQNRPDLADDEQSNFDWLNTVWGLCMEGRSAMSDFRSALDIWKDGWVETINEYKEAHNAIV